MSDTTWQNAWARGMAWAETQPWHGWAALPAGPDRDAKHAAFLEAYERFQSNCDERARAVSEPERRARAEAIWAAQMARYGIPTRVHEAVRNPSDRPAAAAVARWLQSDRWFLCLSGGVGTGKTTAAALALLLDGGFMVTATATADHLFDRPWWDQVESVPCLVIDDLGTEKRDGEGYWLARFWALVDARYREKRRLIVTTNMPKVVFEQVYCSGDGGRTTDRLRDGGMFSTVAGESMRFGAELAPATETAMGATP